MGTSGAARLRACHHCRAGRRRYVRSGGAVPQPGESQHQVKRMLGKLYARWMYRWETALTTRDTNRIVRPVEWGFEWLQEFAQSHGFSLVLALRRTTPRGSGRCCELNDFILHHRARVFRLPDSAGLCARGASPAAVSHQCPPGDLAAGCQASPAGGRRQASQGAVSALYFAGAHALSGERSRQCPLVPRAAGKDGRQA